MRQLLQHICLTYSLGTVLQADSAALSTHGCDTNYCCWVWSLDQTTFPRPHGTTDIKMCSVRFSARPHVTTDIKMCSVRFSARSHVTTDIKMCSVRFSARSHVTTDIKMCSVRFSARPHVTTDIKMCSVRFSEGARHFSLLLNVHTGCGGQLGSCWKGSGFLSKG